MIVSVSFAAKADRNCRMAEITSRNRMISVPAVCKFCIQSVTRSVPGF